MLKKDPWLGYVKPGKIFGNLYFVGTHPASTHLIDSGEGLILIDPGYQESLYLVLNNIWEVGFHPKDIRYIVVSHGHGDHMDATRALVELTGAKTFVGKADLDRVTKKNPGLNECTFSPDVLIEDGDVISLGNTQIRCVTTPGHTLGTVSFFFDVTDGVNTYRAGMHGGVGLNTLNREYLTTHGEPFSNRDLYFASLDKVENEKVDIFIGNHVGNNDTEGKLKRAEEGEENPFLDPTEWKRFIEKCRRGLQELIQKEEEEA